VGSSVEGRRNHVRDSRQGESLPSSSCRAEEESRTNPVQQQEKEVQMKKLLALASLLIAAQASADTVVKYGSNVSKDGDKMGGTKAVFIADQDKIFGPFVRQYEL